MTDVDMSDGVWQFYDAWAAFPLNRVHNDDPRIVGEFNIGLSAPRGGTYGEFNIRFYDFHWRERWRPKAIAARLEAFGDSWRVIASRPDLIAALAPLNDTGQGPDEIRATLVSLGFEDMTERHRGTSPISCPTCHGKGTLGDTDEVDR